MELLNKYGYTLVFAVTLLEQLGFPIPVAPVLLLAGAIAATGDLSFSLVLFFAVVAALIGDVVWFILGRTRGRGVLRFLCHLSLSPDSCVKQTEESFLKYGMNSLLFAKFVPGLNTIAPPMAGLVGASAASFLWRDLAGAILYVLAFLIPGYFLEKKVFDVTNLLEQFGRTFFWVLVGGIVVYVLSKYIKLKLLQRLLYRERITPEELRQRMDAGEDIIILDLRKKSPEGDLTSLIPGAIQISPDEIDIHMNRLDQQRWIVMYCT